MRISSALISVALLASSPALAADRATCEGYAREAVDQHRQNMEHACGYSGPRWQSNYQNHLNWCLGVPDLFVAIERGGRAEELTKCTSKAAAPVFKMIPDAAIVAPRDDQRDTPLRLGPLLAIGSDLNARIATTNVRARTEKRLQLDAKFASKVGSRDRVRAMVATFAARPSSPSATPVILDVRGEPTHHILDAGGFALVAGKGFGTTPGRIWLEYEEERPEFALSGKPHRMALAPASWAGGPNRRAPSLETYWGKDWSPDLVAVKMPERFPGEKVWAHPDEGRAATLILERADGATTRRPVRILPMFPQVTDIESDSGDLPGLDRETGLRWRHFGRETFYLSGDFTTLMGPTYRVRDGDNLYIYGKGFGDTPGQIVMTLNEPQAGRWPVVPFTPGGADWWRDDRIHVVAGNVPGLADTVSASMKITNVAGRTWSAPNTVYGPDTAGKVISGKRWFRGDWKEDESFAREASGGQGLIVSHDPVCGASESGTDWFDIDLADLPEGARLVRIDIKQIDPKNPKSDAEFLKEWGEELLDEIMKYGGLGGVVKHYLGMVGGAISEAFWGEGGGYHAVVYKGPQVGNMSISVGWENACLGPNAGLPVIYAARFLVVGPQWALDRL